jgi:hypothetical protein
MAKVQVETSGRDIFVVVDGVRVARRGHLDMPQEAGTWVSIEYGWEVTDSDEGILIRHKGVSIR